MVERRRPMLPYPLTADEAAVLATARQRQAEAAPLLLPFLVRLCRAAVALLRRVKQALSQKLSGSHPAGAGKQATSDMGGELVQRVDLRHVLEQRNETGARVALVGDEQ